MGYKLFIPSWKRELDSTSGGWMQHTDRLCHFYKNGIQLPARSAGCCLFSLNLQVALSCWVPAEGLLSGARLATKLPICFFRPFLPSCAWARITGTKCWDANALENLLKMWIPEIPIPSSRMRPEALHFTQHPWWTTALPTSGDTLGAPSYLSLGYSRRSVWGLKSFLRLTEMFEIGKTCVGFQIERDNYKIKIV